MGELLACLLGLCIGLARPLWPDCGAGQWRGPALIIVIAVGITYLSGEWAQEPAWALFDLAQVALGGIVGRMARPYLPRLFARSNSHSS